MAEAQTIDVNTDTPPWEAVTGAGVVLALTGQTPAALANRPKFDPRPYLIELKGRGGKTDYLPVAARIAWFRVEHPDGDIEIEPHTITEKIAIFKARVSLPEGGSATGWGSETPADFRDYIEKASTKSLGRALAALGYGTLQAGDEFDERDEVVDAPARSRSKKAPQAPDEATKANNKDGLGFPPVTYEGKKIANMTQMQRAIYAAPGHDERQDLYDLAKAAGWGKPALTVIREDWDGANRADEIATVAE